MRGILGRGIWSEALAKEMNAARMIGKDLEVNMVMTVVAGTERLSRRRGGSGG